MIKLVEDVCPYTPPRILAKKNLETRNKNQQYAKIFTNSKNIYKINPYLPR
jgi:hypothetical protein